MTVSASVATRVCCSTASVAAQPDEIGRLFQQAPLPQLPRHALEIGARWHDQRGAFLGDRQRLGAKRLEIHDQPGTDETRGKQQHAGQTKGEVFSRRPVTRLFHQLYQLPVTLVE